MASAFAIIGAVRGGVQRRKVNAELKEARRERQQAADDRQRMQEQLQAYTANANANDNSYNGGYTNQQGSPMYPEAGFPSQNTAYPYATAQPLGEPTQGVPVQAYPAYAYQGNGQPMQGSATVVHCDRCECDHAPPKCPPLTRREKRQERREDRRERREERREKRRGFVSSLF